MFLVKIFEFLLIYKYYILFVLHNKMLMHILVLITTFSVVLSKCPFMVQQSLEEPEKVQNVVGISIPTPEWPQGLMNSVPF